MEARVMFALSRRGVARVEVIDETEKTYVVVDTESKNPHRLKKSRVNFFDTFDEAKAALVVRLESNVKGSRARLRSDEERLARAYQSTEADAKPVPSYFYL